MPAPSCFRLPRATRLLPAGSAARGLTLAAALGLAACGGGGDSGSASPAGGGGASPAAATPDIGCGLPGFQAEALALVNARRAAGATCGARGSFPPVASLSWDTRLADAAHRHSLDMAEHGLFSHTGSDGSSVGTRVSDAGYAWSAVGENIAAGYGSVQAVVTGWMASDGHCANLMGAGYTGFGLACARNDASPYGLYWTMTLAQPR